MNTKTALQAWGLQDKEIKVYLAALELGQSKVHDIAKKAGILRETTYFVLDHLIEKGLVSYVIKAGVKYFEAANPGKLVTILKEKEEKIKQVLGGLETLYHVQTEKPHVEVYEGKEGLKTILDDIIRSGKPLVNIANSKLFEILKYDFPKFILRRVEKKIPVRVIQQRVAALEEVKKRDKKEYRHMRFAKVVPKSNVFIYGDKVAFINATEHQLMGVIIKNKDMAAMQMQIYDLLWDQCEE